MIYIKSNEYNITNNPDPKLKMEACSKKTENWQEGSP